MYGESNMETYITIRKIDQIRSDQSLSRVRLFATLWIAAHQASLSITNSWSSLRLTSIESVMPSSHLILCRPLLLLPPIPPSFATLCYNKFWDLRHTLRGLLFNLLHTFFWEKNHIITNNKKSQFIKNNEMHNIFYCKLHINQFSWMFSLIFAELLYPQPNNNFS